MTDSSSATERRDVYTRVTDSIIESLEQGVRPWHRPWEGGLTDGRMIRPLRHNGTPYRGINILLLWGAAMEHGFSSPHWMTYRQAMELGAHVRKGERGSLVVYAGSTTKPAGARVTPNDGATDANGDEAEREVRFMKGYTVFNVAQIDGLPAQYHPQPTPPREPMPLIEHAEAFVAATGAALRHGGDRAYYSPGADVIVLPVPESFRDAASYTATKAHELVHWTSAAARCDRVLGKRFGDDAYAAEELIAELGAAFLCADLGITPEVRDDHAAYISHWLKVLKSDRRAIFTAASHAQRAADYLHGLQPEAKAGAA
jgi:antirestriction protein ArdC